jgi:phage FluMu protein Com
MKIYFSNDLNGKCGKCITEAITKMWLKVKQPEGVTMNSAMSVKHPLYFLRK